MTLKETLYERWLDVNIRPPPSEDSRDWDKLLLDSRLLTGIRSLQKEEGWYPSREDSFCLLPLLLAGDDVIRSAPYYFKRETRTTCALIQVAQVVTTQLPHPDTNNTHTNTSSTLVELMSVVAVVTPEWGAQVELTLKRLTKNIEGFRITHLQEKDGVVDGCHVLITTYSLLQHWVLSTEKQRGLNLRSVRVLVLDDFENILETLEKNSDPFVRTTRRMQEASIYHVQVAVLAGRIDTIAKTTD